MIARSIYCALFIIIQSGMCSAQEVFHRSYGGTGDDYGRAVDICASGGYIIAGSTNSFINPSTDVYLLRIDESGEFMWGKNIGEPNYIEWGIDVAEDAEGNFYVAGYTNNTGGNSYDGMLLKTDGDGNLLWKKTFGGTDWDFFNGMEMDAAGNIYLAGSATTDDGQKGWVIKTDPEGIIIWESYVTIPGTTAIHGISMCTDGTLAFVGALSSFDPIGKTIIAGLVEPDGNIVWNESFPDLGDAEANGCVCDWHDDVIKLMGTIIVDTGDDNVPYMIIAGIDLNQHDVEWSDIFGSDEDDQGWAIDVKDNGTLVVCGGYSEGAYLSEKSAQGAYLGINNGFVLGTENNQILFDIIATPDGGYITVGETNSYGENYQVYLIKVGPENEFVFVPTDFIDVTTPTLNQSKDEIKIYPNPASNYINIETSTTIPTKISFIDISGRIVYSDFLHESNRLELSQNFQPGIYILEIKNVDLYYHTKVIINNQ